MKDGWMGNELNQTLCFRVFSTIKPNENDPPGLLYGLRAPLVWPAGHMILFLFRQEGKSEQLCVMDEVTMLVSSCQAHKFSFILHWFPIEVFYGATLPACIVCVCIKPLPQSTRTSCWKTGKRNKRRGQDWKEKNQDRKLIINKRKCINKSNDLSIWSSCGFSLQLHILRKSLYWLKHKMK